MISRRRFLQSSLTVALVPMLPKLALSADLRVRQSWDSFCAGPTFDSFIYAVKTMRATSNSRNPASWEYWAVAHRYLCPHGKPYFLAWHRGFLYRFEEMLRQVSGDQNLVLPYWNYYAQPSLPDQFQDSTSPLYRGDRTGTDVYGALSMDPFASTLTHFVRYNGSSDAFEPTVESRPHNPVHNLVGGVMAWISYSPRDPLFWVHHANIDRLWVAWLAAGGGRREPDADQSYWSGDLSYGKSVDSIPISWTRDTRNFLGYQYDDEAMPTGLPPDPSPSTSQSSLATSATAFSLAGVTARPAVVRSTSLGTSQALDLDEKSSSVQVLLTPQDANRVRSAMMQPVSATSTAAATQTNNAVRVVLDGIELSKLGKKGGYFYKVFVNLPKQGVATREEQTFLVGMVGAFEISVAQMQASMKGSGMQGMDHMKAQGNGKTQLVFPATEALKRAWPTSLDHITVSFVRVDGRKNPSKGRVIQVKSFRLEADPAK